MAVDLHAVAELALRHAWAFARIAALVMSAPVFGTRTVPARVKLGIALLITVAVAGTLPDAPLVDLLSARGLFLVALQVAIGAALGFAMRLVFAAVESGAHVMSLQMGLGFASMVDPGQGITVPVVSQFYSVLATLIFLAMNGHLVMIQVVVDSFELIPVGATISGGGFYTLAAWGSWIFAGGVLMALPAVAALLMANIAFGVMSRAAPQLNIFTVGFPVTMLFGFIVMFLILPIVVPHVVELVRGATDMAMGLGSGQG